MSSNFNTTPHGTKFWCSKNGVLHRDGDLPAVEHTDNSKEWWKHGKLHREQDKPAIEYSNGGKLWYKNGKSLTPQEVKALKRKWKAIRNGDTEFLAGELLNEL